MSRRAPLVLTVLLLMSACTGGDPVVPPPQATPTDGTPSSPAGTSPVTPDVVTLDAPADGSFLVHGLFPSVESSCRRTSRPVLRARYPGTLRVERVDDGTLTVLVTLPFERYLEGIAEVPSSWPAAALEAQAIAARTYALAVIGWSGEGDALEEPICSTASCQVYGGMPVPPEPGIGRWRAAVRRTRGRMLIHDGRPAQTLYFSTSDGRTRGNDEVFGSDPLPYLRPVRERDDGASPTSRWRVEVPLTDLATILVAADLWRDGARIHRATVHGDTVRLTGAGLVRAVAADDLRDALNAWGPCLLPGRYPTDSRFGSPLPVTVPSEWFTASGGRDALVLQGRGWGHGVGMVQWGAHGRAERGMSAAEILAAYYGGLRPQRFPEPEVIDVEVATGLTSLRVVADGRGARIDGASLDRDGVVIEGGAQLRIDNL